MFIEWNYGKKGDQLFTQKMNCHEKVPALTQQIDMCCIICDKKGEIERKYDFFS